MKDMFVQGVELIKKHCDVVGDCKECDYAVFCERNFAREPYNFTSTKGDWDE